MPPPIVFLGSWPTGRGRGRGMYSNRVPPVRQAGFDQTPVEIQQADLLGNAKRLYGVLCSMQRMGHEWTYAQLATELHASERSIVRWVQRLVEAGLVAVRRRGQGLPNLFRVLALVTSGRASLPKPALPKRQPSTRYSSLKKKKEAGRMIPAHVFYGSAAIHLPGG